MSYKIIGHIADVRLSVESETSEGLFEDAMAGMTKILGPEIKKGQGNIVRKIKIVASDKTALLIDFLNEILSFAHVNKETFNKIKVKKISETKFEAELAGNKIEGFKEDIKAVTYHEAKIIKNKKGKLETNIVFDI